MNMEYFDKAADFLGFAPMWLSMGRIICYNLWVFRRFRWVGPSGDY